MGQIGRRSDEPDRLVAETGCPCSVGSKERCHNRILYIAWRADRIERKQQLAALSIRIQLGLHRSSDVGDPLFDTALQRRLAAVS
jgi:hypothetical protein